MLTMIINREFRLSRGISMRKFAASLGMSHGTVWNNENFQISHDYVAAIIKHHGAAVYANFEKQVAIDLITAGENPFQVMRTLGLSSITLEV